MVTYNMICVNFCDMIEKGFKNIVHIVGKAFMPTATERMNPFPTVSDIIDIVGRGLAPAVLKDKRKNERKKYV